jgi:hypothetical protein
VRRTLGHEFVEYVPHVLAEGVLYISTTYNTCLHLCCCGCGSEVVLPISPTDWAFSYDGAHVSLHPSVGNWSFPCRSHYVVTRGVVQAAPAWSDQSVEAGRQRDEARKRGFFEERAERDPEGALEQVVAAPSAEQDAHDLRTSLVRRLLRHRRALRRWLP